MINHHDFMRVFARNIKERQARAEEILNIFQETVFELLEEDDKIKICDFLVIEKKEVKERRYKLPNSDEEKVKESYYKIDAKITDKYRKVI